MVYFREFAAFGVVRRELFARPDVVGLAALSACPRAARASRS
jgi:hypothetical protein